MLVRWGRWAISIAFLVLLWPGPGRACGPGRGAGGRRTARRRLTPLVFKQHVPNVSENTLGASGLPEGRIHNKNDPRFKELVVNHNADIMFKNEEGTGTDRLMTQRCKEKLNTLAISVMNQWPGVKLRVTEAWDNEGIHSVNSLHYEGRAVDITTSDRDRSKYGLLARLAVQAGFDWVYYESKSHIHCSVKSESSQAAKSGGCFPGNSTVRTPSGPKSMWQVVPGDKLLTVDNGGRLVYSEVLLLLDRNPDTRRVFHVLETEDGRSVTVTANHLVFVSATDSVTVTPRPSRVATFARDVKVGQLVYVKYNDTVTLQRVVDNRLSVHVGIFAPLTYHGTVIVDDVLASCYAIIDSDTLAHWAFFPVRTYYTTKSVLTKLVQRLSAITRLNSINSSSNSDNKLDQGYSDPGSSKGAASSDQVSNGIHWYAKILYSVAQWLLPKHLVYND